MSVKESALRAIFEAFTTRNRPETKTPTEAVGVTARKLQGFLEDSLVRLAGIEPTTLGFGGQYSIH